MGLSLVRMTLVLLVLSGVAAPYSLRVGPHPHALSLGDFAPPSGRGRFSLRVGPHPHALPLGDFTPPSGRGRFSLRVGHPHALSLADFAPRSGRGRFSLRLGPHPHAAAAQAPAAGAPSRATLIGRGWTAIGAGRPAEAEKIADGLLAVSPRNHDAAALKIEARAAGGRAIAALDAYEQWQSAVGREDPFIMAPIAVGLLRAASTTDGELRAKFRALEILAGAGDAGARQALAAAATDSFMEADAALVRLGNTDAAARLEQRIEGPSARDKSDLIDALRRARSKRSATAIARALQDPAMPTRMAAARALGDLDARDSIPQLIQALKDPEPPVRFIAAVALAKLGSTAGDDLVRQLENSPVGDMRMLAAEVSAPGNPSGPWVAEATKVLQDPDPLARLRAAELLVRHAADPSAGLESLRMALAENNPAIRFAAADLLEDLPRSPFADDLPGLRRLLRDPSASVRVEAAGILLRLSAADLR